MPIEHFVDVLEPKSIGLQDKSQFYAPIQFVVQICGGVNAPAGAIKVDVPVHANPAWLQTMKSRFAGMVPDAIVGQSPAKIDFRTTTGESISQVALTDLSRVGKLSLFVNDKLVRLPTMPAIPVEYSVAKVGKIETWMNDTLEELPEKIASELVGKDLVQAEAAWRVGGSVQRLVEDHIRKSMNDWSEFIRIHHMNSPTQIGPSDAQAVLKTISGNVMDMFRKFTSSAAPQVNAYLASVNAKAIGSQMLLADKQAYFSGDGHELYQKLAEDALASPSVRETIVNTIYNHTWSVGCRWDEVEERKSRSAAKRDEKRAVPKSGGKVLPKERKQGGAAMAKVPSVSAPKLGQYWGNGVNVEDTFFMKARGADGDDSLPIPVDFFQLEEFLVRSSFARIRKFLDNGELAAMDTQVVDQFYDDQNQIGVPNWDPNVELMEVKDYVTVKIRERISELSPGFFTSLWRGATNVVNYFRPRQSPSQSSGGGDPNDSDGSDYSGSSSESEDELDAATEEDVQDASPVVKPKKRTAAPRPLPPKDKEEMEEVDVPDQQPAAGIPANLTSFAQYQDFFTRATPNQWDQYTQNDPTLADIPNEDINKILTGLVGEFSKKAAYSARRKRVVTESRAKKNLPPLVRSEVHHPWNAQIHHTLQPVAGVYPTYYNVLHTKQDMTKDAPYAGNVEKTYAAYHMFAGVPISPPGVSLAPVESRMRSKRGGSKSKRRSRGGNQYNEDETIESHMQPIACHSGNRVPESDSEEEEDGDAPIFSQIASRPPLMPLGAAMPKVVVVFPGLKSVDDLFGK